MAPKTRKPTILYMSRLKKFVTLKDIFASAIRLLMIFAARKVIPTSMVIADTSTGQCQRVFFSGSVRVLLPVRFFTYRTIQQNKKELIKRSPSEFNITPEL